MIPLHLFGSPGHASSPFITYCMIQIALDVVQRNSISSSLSVLEKQMHGWQLLGKKSAHRRSRLFSPQGIFPFSVSRSHPLETNHTQSFRWNRYSFRCKDVTSNILKDFTLNFIARDSGECHWIPGCRDEGPLVE